MPTADRMTDARKTKPDGRVRCRIFRAGDGTYAVESEPGCARPLTISGFESADEARTWIEAARLNDQG